MHTQNKGNGDASGKSLFRVRTEECGGRFLRECAGTARPKDFVSTAKVLKSLRVPVVSFRLNGAYLTIPAGLKSRKGKIRLTTVFCLPEQLKTLSVDEIYQRCAQGLVQTVLLAGERMIPFVGKRLAEGWSRFFSSAQLRWDRKLSSKDDTTTGCGETCATINTDILKRKWRASIQIGSGMNQWQLKELENMVRERMIAQTHFETGRSPCSQGSGMCTKKLEGAPCVFYVDRRVHRPGRPKQSSSCPHERGQHPPVGLVRFLP